MKSFEIYIFYGLRWKSEKKSCFAEVADISSLPPIPVKCYFFTLPCLGNTFSPCRCISQYKESVYAFNDSYRNYFTVVVIFCAASSFSDARSHIAQSNPLSLAEIVHFIHYQIQRNYSRNDSLLHEFSFPWFISLLTAERSLPILH